MTIEYILPISVTLPRKTKADRKVMLNYNNAVHWNPFFWNAIKKAFEPISGQGFSANKIRVNYQIEKTTKRSFDTDNIFTVVNKCFMDWLVRNECLPDDNCDVVKYGYIEGLKDCAESRAVAKIEIIE